MNNNSHRLSRLIEPEVITGIARGWLAQQGLGLAEARLDRIFPRGKDEFVFAVDISTDDGKSHGAWFEVVDNAKVYVQSVVESLAKNRRRQITKSCRDAIYLDPDHNIVVRELGLDEQIPGFNVFSQTKALVSLCEDFLCLPNNSLRAVPQIEVLAHRLGKRAVVKVQIDQHELVIKCFKAHSQKAENSYHRLRACTNQGLSVPKTFGVAPDFEMLAMQVVEGALLSQCAVIDRISTIQISAQLLAKLHTISLPNLPLYDPTQEVELLQGWVELVSIVQPDKARWLQKALITVAADLTRLPAVTPAVCHRDFYDHQVLATDRSATMLDFDTACWSDPSIDLANYVAHIRLFNLQHASGGMWLDDNDFLEAYAEHRAIEPNRIRAWRRATFLRLFCLYSFWPKCSNLTAELAEAVYE